MSNNITGQIYILLEEQVFPEEGWYDFPVVILSWWLRSITNILDSPLGTSCEFAFMDGPLLVRGIKHDSEALALSFIKDKLDGEMVFFTAMCNTKQFKDSLVNASKKVIKYVEEIKKWRTDDIDELKKLSNLLSHS